MKIISLILAALLVLITRAMAQTDYQARHCEIFVEKVSAHQGGFNSRNLVFTLKVLEQRLDSEVQQVAFRFTETVRPKAGPSYSAEHELTALREKGGALYRLMLPVEHDDAKINYKGSFFVKTAYGTNYWLNTRERGDFHLTTATFEWIHGLYGEQGTQTRLPGPDHFNPDRCY